MKRKLFFKLLFVLTVWFLLGNTAFADNTNDWKSDVSSDIAAKSTVEKYKDTLEYGIEKEISGVLKNLGRTPLMEFYPLLITRYQEAVLAETKISLVNYFAECTNLPDQIINLLYDEAKAEPAEIKLYTSLLNFLGEKGKKREGLLLLECLDNPNQLIQLSAADALTKIRDDSLIQLILDRLNLADTDNEKYLSNDVKSKIILAFGEMKALAAVAYLKKVISEPTNDKYMIMYGMVSLAKIDDTSSIPLIEKNLASSEIKIQEYAAYALSLYKTAAVLPILRKALKHNNEKIRIYACQGLVLNNDTSSIKGIVYKIENDPSILVRTEALGSLLSMGISGLNALKDFLKNKKNMTDYYLVIAEAVADKPDDLNVMYLVTLYDAANDKERELIAKGVIKGESNKLDPIVKKLLLSKDYLIRINAITMIARIKNSGLWGMVMDLAKNDPSSVVKKTAQNYLDLKN